MYVCMYVYMYACVYVYMYVCLSVRQSIRLSVCLKCAVEPRSPFHASPSPAGSLTTDTRLSSPQPSHCTDLAVPSSGTFVNVMLRLCEDEFRRKCQVLIYLSSGCRTVPAGSHSPRCYRRRTVREGLSFTARRRLAEWQLLLSIFCVQSDSTRRTEFSSYVAVMHCLWH
jgi:hypothetical protein